MTFWKKRFTGSEYTQSWREALQFCCRHRDNAPAGYSISPCNIPKVKTSTYALVSKHIQCTQKNISTEVKVHSNHFHYSLNRLVFVLKSKSSFRYTNEGYVPFSLRKKTRIRNRRKHNTKMSEIFLLLASATSQQGKPLTFFLFVWAGLSPKFTSWETKWVVSFHAAKLHILCLLQGSRAKPFWLFSRRRKERGTENYAQCGGSGKSERFLPLIELEFIQQNCSSVDCEQTKGRTSILDAHLSSETPCHWTGQWLIAQTSLRETEHFHWGEVYQLGC